MSQDGNKKRERQEDAEEKKIPCERTADGLITASIRTFPRARRRADDDDDAEYNRRVFTREALILREKQRILSEIDAPRDERCDKLLKWECDVKGLASNGIRAILLQRLAGHDAGQKVMLAAHANQSKAARIDPEAARAQSVKPTVLLRLGNGRGEEGLLALPHDLIRNVLLPRVHLFALVCLARTCKYLAGDVTAELWKRARAIFGETGGTPKAVGVLMALSTNYISRPATSPYKTGTYWEKWWDNTSEYERRETARTVCSKLGIGYNQAFTSSKMEWLVTKELPFLDTRLVCGHYYEAVHVARCILKYGTVDACITSVRLKREKAELQAVERETLLTLEKERVAAVNQFIGLKLFAPGTDKSVTQLRDCIGDGGRAKALNLTPLGRLAYAVAVNKRDLWKAHVQVTKHVYTGKPSTVAGACANTKGLVRASLNLLEAATATGKLTEKTLVAFEWVFVHVGALFRRDYTPSVAASMCRVATDSGLERLCNPKRFLATDTEMPHCVMLSVQHKEFRIVYVPQKIQTVHLLEGKAKVYTLTRAMVIDALPSSDAEMKTALLAKKGSLLLPHWGPSVNSDWQQQKDKDLFYMDTKRATLDHGRPTSFGGYYYRPQWLPFAPVFAIVE